MLHHAAITLWLRDGALRVVVVSDTHSRPHPKMMERIEGERPDHILHAGDIGDLAVLVRLATIAPTSAVRGNIDAHDTSVPDTLTVEVRDGGDGEGGDRSVCRLVMLHIGVGGVRLRAEAIRLARAEGASIVVCGHSHVPFLGRDGALTVFNPGSAGPRRFQLPIVFGVLEIGRGRVEMWHVDCETGRRWVP